MQSRDGRDKVTASVCEESYRICPGDTLSINIQTKSSVVPSVELSDQPRLSSSPDADGVPVSPSGDIYVRLAGKVAAAGKTVAEVEDILRTKLSKYLKRFEVAVSVAKLGDMNIWISGQVDNPGPHVVPVTAVASQMILQAGIKPNGSTRRLRLTHGGQTRRIDLYRMTITGNTEDDLRLEPGDSIHVPPVTAFVEVSGEINRPGRYEMVGLGENSDTFRVSDLIDLALGVMPTAARDKAFIERTGENDKKRALPINLSRLARGSADDMALNPGDILVIPSISAFQSMIRLIGEFKGEGVYQRAPGVSPVEVQNKGGIYPLKQGQTVESVITATGGVTPQADLKRARIERRHNGTTETIPVDLERLLVLGDKTADVVLQNGDSLVLPALAERIHVFGEVKLPGSYTYSPNRRLVDYLGNAGGPTTRAKLTEVAIVRGDTEKPEVIKLDVKAALRGGDAKGNPILCAGDIVYVPPKFVSDWRDLTQMLFTSLSLVSLFNRL